MTVTVQVTGLDAIQARLRRIGSGEILRRIGRVVGDELEEQTRERLGTTKTSPSGARWLPWRDPSDHGPGEALLEESGRLLRSIRSRLAGDTVEVGSPLLYAATMQAGSPRRGIAPRPFLGLSRQNRAAVERLVLAQIEGVLA